MNNNELLQKYKREFLKSEVFLNWKNDFVIKNTDSPKMFVCIFNKYNESIIGFKIGIHRDEKYISIYWYGEEDKYFELSEEGFQKALKILYNQLDFKL